MINYLAKFAPQLSETTKPLRNLLKENVEFIRDHKQDEALKKAKELKTPANPSHSKLMLVNMESEVHFSRKEDL